MSRGRDGRQYLDNLVILNQLRSSQKKTLNDWSRAKQLILFPENLNVSRGGAEENTEIRGKQN